MAHRVLRIDLAYDGTAFHGWQVQAAARTVQGELGAALSKVLGEPVTVVGASRTDAGVHARGQVASVATTRSGIASDELARALNALTGDDVVIRAVGDAHPAFHARFSALGKRYRYRIRTAPARSPFDRWFAWHLPRPLDVAAMRPEAAAIVGRHDFASFQGAGSDVGSTVREVTGVEIIVADEYLDVWIEGGGFLRHMVRNLVGTLAEIGRGRYDAGHMKAVLEARSRAAAGPTAPAQGLFLEEVLYSLEARRGGEP